VTDPILLLLILDAAALLCLGACAALIPSQTGGLFAALLSGAGLLLTLPALLPHAAAAQLALPIGPPGLGLHFALDPLTAFFVVIVLLAGTAVAAVQTRQPATVRMTAFCVAGTTLALLAADGIALTLAVTITCAATASAPIRHDPLMTVPVLLLAAVCLLTPPGYAPRFDAIRAAPIDTGHAAAAVALTVAACFTLGWSQRGSAVRDALAAGILLPLAAYLLLRLIVDLPATAPQAWWGYVLLLAGGAVAVVSAWGSSTRPDIDAAVAALTQRQAGLAATGVGLALIARSADLPGAATFALDATCLTVVAAGLAGTAAALTAEAIERGAGTARLSRLGGLAHTMPRAAIALAASLLAASALPPSLGFASLWLSFQSILSGPRTGGLLPQLPLALTAAMLALSAALATAASVRIVGIALLGRPRTPRGAGATEAQPRPRTILLALSGAAVCAGLLPGPLLRLLADPAVRALTGLPPSQGLGLLSGTGSSPGYLAIPLLALLGLTCGAAWLGPRLSPQAAKPAGPWTDGMQPPIGLPFGDPAAQSAGMGFVPALPRLRLTPLNLPPFSPPHIPASIGQWLMLATFATLLVVLACVG
jgi:formate hydrogenlyase subunit 3/multisubunit Na+/H+ antiporter MnhD subunit